MNDATKTLTEDQRLDALSSGEAKAILFQIGYFADNTHFLSLRFTDEQFRWVQESISFSGESSTEQFFANLCREEL